ncbi:MAG: nucleoid-associated protein [Ferruginibacter sp.]
MITAFEATIEQLSIHKSGNKANSEPCTLSEQPFPLVDETLTRLLMQFFIQPFEKIPETYRLHHSSGNPTLNEVYHFCNIIFNEPYKFHDSSIALTQHLYNTSNHPKIKNGEFYIVLFKDIQADGMIVDALGLFKSENKEPFLKVKTNKFGVEVQYEIDGINIKKLDKGCLILNVEKEEGYRVMVIDQTNKNTEAHYWIDEFLQLKIRSDEYTQTNTALTLCKNYVTEQIDKEFEISKTEKIDLLNRSIRYFKQNEAFDLNGFAEEVIGNDPGIESFKQYKTQFEQQYDLPIPDAFDISNAAVKKQARVYKSILKLDRNFHIYIHGNKDLIERGYDEQTGKYFYKIYFDQEQ